MQEKKKKPTLKKYCCGERCDIERQNSLYYFHSDLRKSLGYTMLYQLQQIKLNNTNLKYMNSHFLKKWPSLHQHLFFPNTDLYSKLKYNLTVPNEQRTVKHF